MPVIRLTPPYVESYRALMLQAYARHPEAFTSSVAERETLPLDWWQSRLSESNDHQLFFGAVHEGQLAGACGLSLETRPRSAHKATLIGMYVQAEQRRHGWGQQLVEAALTHARSLAQLRLVQLTVTQGNDSAQRLYERCGFVPYGLEPLAVTLNEGYTSKLLMWLDLRPGT